MPRNRHNGRSTKVPRKTEDEWAVLAVPGATLEKRLKLKEYSVRKAAAMCGHQSHSHIWRLMHDPAVTTTSIHTADMLEAITDSRGLLFARMSARTSNRVAA